MQGTCSEQSKESDKGVIWLHAKRLTPHTIADASKPTVDKYVSVTELTRIPDFYNVIGDRRRAYSHACFHFKRTSLQTAFLHL